MTADVGTFLLNVLIDTHKLRNSRQQGGVGFSAMSAKHVGVRLLITAWSQASFPLVPPEPEQLAKAPADPRARQLVTQAGRRQWIVSVKSSHMSG